MQLDWTILRGEQIMYRLRGLYERVRLPPV